MYYAIDRMEESVATLLADNGARREVPAEQLPGGAREGDVLLWADGAFTSAPEETARRRKQTQELLARLLGEEF